MAREGLVRYTECTETPVRRRQPPGAADASPPCHYKRVAGVHVPIAPHHAATGCYRLNAAAACELNWPALHPRSQ